MPSMTSHRSLRLLLGLRPFASAVTISCVEHLTEALQVFVVPEISKTWILKDWDCAMACHGRHRARTGH